MVVASEPQHRTGTTKYVVALVKGLVWLDDLVHRVTTLWKRWASTSLATSPTGMTGESKGLAESAVLKRVAHVANERRSFSILLLVIAHISYPLNACDCGEGKVLGLLQETKALKEDSVRGLDTQHRLRLV